MYYPPSLAYYESLYGSPNTSNSTNSTNWSFWQSYLPVKYYLYFDDGSYDMYFMNGTFAFVNYTSNYYSDNYTYWNDTKCNYTMDNTTLELQADCVNGSYIDYPPPNSYYISVYGI
jgi:hypothetical protein